jgi:lipoate-protein ligase A
MRVIDFGTVKPLRSQSVWHALCRAMQPGDAPVLSFVRPAAPYVSIGYHRDLAEVDIDYCLAAGLPVYRRMVGGGPVFCDSGQLFFQINLPARDLPARRATALAMLLRPAARALRRLGVDAELDRFGEISVGPAKVCGHGAGQLGDGATVVGNLITGFDHERATRVLRLDPAVRGIVLRLMRRHVAATPVDPAAWQAAMVREYAEHFGSAPCDDRLTPAEMRQLARMDRRLLSDGFVAGTSRPVRPVRTVKVRAGVWVHDWRGGGDRVVLGIAGGTVEVADGREHLVGLRLDDAIHELEREHEAAPLVTAIQAAHAEVA